VRGFPPGGGWLAAGVGVSGTRARAARRRLVGDHGAGGDGWAGDQTTPGRRRHTVLLFDLGVPVVGRVVNSNGLHTRT
jgi:hypothetical protein